MLYKWPKHSSEIPLLQNTSNHFIDTISYSSSLFSSKTSNSYTYQQIFGLLSALIVQWLWHLVVAEKTWVRFPLGAHNSPRDNNLDEETFFFFSLLSRTSTGYTAFTHIAPTCFSCGYLLVSIVREAYVRISTLGKSSEITACWPIEWDRCSAAKCGREWRDFR